MLILFSKNASTEKWNPLGLDQTDWNEKKKKKKCSHKTTRRHRQEHDYDENLAVKIASNVFQCLTTTHICQAIDSLFPRNQRLVVCQTEMRGDSLSR